MIPRPLRAKIGLDHTRQSFFRKPPFIFLFLFCAFLFISIFPLANYSVSTYLTCIMTITYPFLLPHLYLYPA